MKLFLSIFAASTLLVASTHIAQAAPLVVPANLAGDLTVSGTGHATLTGFTLGSASLTDSTYTAEGFDPGHNVTTNPTFSFAGASGEEMLFEFLNTSGNEGLEFDSTAPVVDHNGVYTITGDLNLYSCVALCTAPGNHTLLLSDAATAIFTSTGPDSFSLSVDVAPEPGSLILLATGLASMGPGLLLRRRKA